MHAVETDAVWMRRALEEARLSVGCTSPNPPVGAVLVRDGRLLATGRHRRAGGPHAEIDALDSLSSPQDARGATLYVTLEPCSSHGRTPPCCETIRDAGIARVVYGSTDPDPRHQGSAGRILKAAQIDVLPGILEEACDDLIRVFRHWTVRGKPYVIAKAALSLDGRLSRPPGESTWLSSPESQADAQWLRQQCDAILVGAATIRRDNPSLTLRYESSSGKEQPWRIVLTRSADLPQYAQVFRDSHAHRTLVLQDQTIPALLADLSSRGITCLLVEGGGEVLGSFLAAQAVQELHIYFAPLLCGGRHRIRFPAHAQPSILAPTLTEVRQIGGDVRLTVCLP